MFTTMHGRVEFMVSRVWYGREYCIVGCGRVESMHGIVGCVVELSVWYSRVIIIIIIKAYTTPIHSVLSALQW